MSSPEALEDRLIGVIHLPATPGAPGFEAGGSGMEALIERAVEDARAYTEGGIHSLVVENFHDAPFFKEAAPPATLAAMAIAASHVRAVDGVRSLGINVLRNDALGALGVAAAVGADFVRVNVHTGAMYTDQGLIEGRAAKGRGDFTVGPVAATSLSATASAGRSTSHKAPFRRLSTPPPRGTSCTL